MKHLFLAVALLAFATTYSSGQNKQVSSSDYLSKRWKDVATRMPSTWYGSGEAKLVAENVLLSQKEIGGWEKNKDYHKEFSKSERAHYINDKSETGATFDNGATITELKFLAKVYSQIHDARYKQAFENGLNYIIIAQYENGGWPQYFPVKDAADEILVDKTKPYSMHITFNDEAMVNTMQFLKEIITENPAYGELRISEEKKAEARIAFNKGIQCILNTQIIVDGKPTVWCAQHHEVTLAPANARSYELASFSGSESVDIVRLLMHIENPSEDIIVSVDGAIKWFENNKIEGIKIERIINEDGEKDRVVVEDRNAPPLWGRFYDLKTSKPFFCSRDGIKRNSLAEISHERRNGYSWYTSAPTRLLEDYPEWLAKNKQSTSRSQQLAFPSAEGFGAFSKGGRGGSVLYVTNLDDQGPGSLRWAVEQEGPRTVVFSVSGTIELKTRLDIEDPFLTIAGQTAPGDGICLKGETVKILTNDIIIRYIRVRLGDGKFGEGGTNQGKDAIDISVGEDIIVDHCSASWSLDEIISTSTSNPTLTRVTVQWCFITEGLNPDNHGFGSLIRGTGGAKYSYLHNLYAHNRGRNPRPGNYDSNPHNEDPEGLLLDFRNNVIYNWGGGHAGYNADSNSVTLLNYVDNYLISGADSKPSGIAYSTGSPFNRSYFAGNYYNNKLPDNQWDLVSFRDSWTDEEINSYKRNEPFETGPVLMVEAYSAYQGVLKSGGASLPKRDIVDRRIVNDVKNLTGKIIKSQEDVGGWPMLKSVSAPTDTDHDGMPDDWENKNGLDPNNASDRNNVTQDGYTILEQYLNSIK